MKHSALLWSLQVVYFVVLGIIYQSVSGEVAGSTLLLFAAAFGGLIAGWLWRSAARMDPGGDDLPGGDMAGEVGMVGEFTSESIRPLGIAVGISGAFLGVAVGLWMTAAGLAILASQVALMVWDTDR